jgi:hypothetical protein
MNGKPNLFEMITTLHSPCGFTGCLHGGQEKSD